MRKEIGQNYFAATLCFIQDTDGDLPTAYCPAFDRLSTINSLLVFYNQEVLIHNVECIRAFLFLSACYIFANNNKLS